MRNRGRGGEPSTFNSVCSKLDLLQYKILSDKNKQIYLHTTRYNNSKLLFAAPDVAGTATLELACTATQGSADRLLLELHHHLPRRKDADDEVYYSILNDSTDVFTVIFNKHITYSVFEICHGILFQWHVTKGNRYRSTLLL